jgi:DNA-binding FrmR family transcriptional regulator
LGARARRPRAPCLGLALGALVLGVAGAARAQDQPVSEQQLIERLRQIQGEVGQGAGRAAGASEQELLERVQRIQGEVGGAAPQAEAQLTADQVRQRISEDLGVEVLSVGRVSAGERPAYALKVMNPPGNYNAAFRVVTLLVDGDSGAVLGEIQTTPSAETSDAFPGHRASGEESGLELRRRSHR